MNFPGQKKVREAKNNHPKGTRVELIRCDDPYRKMTPGEKGTVESVDDMGTVFVIWDSGFRLGLCLGEDQYKKI